MPLQAHNCSSQFGPHWQFATVSVLPYTASDPAHDLIIVCQGPPLPAEDQYTPLVSSSHVTASMNSSHGSNTSLLYCTLKAPLDQNNCCSIHICLPSPEYDIYESRNHISLVSFLSSQTWRFLSKRAWKAKAHKMQSWFSIQDHLDHVSSSCNILVGAGLITEQMDTLGVKHWSKTGLCW